jgi:hypothetical protein
MSVHYAVRVRGNQRDAVRVAQQEGLSAEVLPSVTAISGSAPDQAALCGLLARLRLLGLELIDVRRLHRASAARQPSGSDPPDTSERGNTSSST